MLSKMMIPKRVPTPWEMFDTFYLCTAGIRLTIEEPWNKDWGDFVGYPSIPYILENNLPIPRWGGVSTYTPVHERYYEPDFAHHVKSLDPFKNRVFFFRHEDDAMFFYMKSKR